MKPPDELPVLFLLSRVLGGKTFSSHLQKVVATMEQIRPHFVFLDEEDYGRHRGEIPLLNRMTGLYIAPSILKWKLRGTRLPAYRAVFVQSFEIMPACTALDPDCPVILAHDSTNILSYRLLRDVDPGPLASLACAFKSVVASPAYRAVLGRVKAFLPRTHWCGRSLTRDFGVDPDRIIVAPSGLDMDLWKPDWDRRADPPVLLFVGNDFARKGGEFLMEVFARLGPIARLRILSNDPSLRGRAWPEGVELVSGLGHHDPGAVARAYREADIFVFPTRKDHMGMVLTEAAASGLPLVGTDVGGVKEAIRDGENGRLLPYGAGPGDWAAAIEDLIRDPDKRRRYGRFSRGIAETEFSFGALRERVEAAFGKLGLEDREYVLKTDRPPGLPIPRA